LAINPPFVPHQKCRQRIDAWQKKLRDFLLGGWDENLPPEGSFPSPARKKSVIGGATNDVNF